MHWAYWLEDSELGRRLQIFARTHRLVFLGDQIRLHARQLVHEAVHDDHQIALDREVVERLDPDDSATVIAQEGMAG